MPATLFQTRQLSDNLVLNTKLSDMVSQTIKGRVTAGTGDPEDLTSTQVRSILGLSTTDIVQFGNINTKVFNIAVPTTVGNGTEICTVVNGSYASCIDIWFCVHDSGFAISKRYALAAFYNDTNNVWQKLVPLSSSGAYGAEDCELDIKTSANTSTIRFRRTGGSTAGTARIVVSVGGDPSGTTITASSATYTGITGLSDYNQTSLTMLGGNVGIGIGVPTSKLHVIGTTSTSTLVCPGNNSYINLSDENYLGGVTYFRSKGAGAVKASIDGPTGNIASVGGVNVGGTVQGSSGYFTGANGTYVGRFSGTSYGLRLSSTSSSGFYIEATDPTFATTYEPLTLGGSAITLNANTFVVGNTSITGTLKNSSLSNALANGYRVGLDSYARIIGTNPPEFELWHDSNSVGQFKYTAGVLTYGTHSGGGSPSYNILSVSPSALVFKHYNQSGSIELSTGGAAGYVATPLNMDIIFRGYMYGDGIKAKISCPEVSANYGTTHLGFFVQNSSSVLTEYLRIARSTGNILMNTTTDYSDRLTVFGDTLGIRTSGGSTTTPVKIHLQDMGYPWYSTLEHRIDWADTRFYTNYQGSSGYAGWKFENLESTTRTLRAQIKGDGSAEFTASVALRYGLFINELSDGSNKWMIYKNNADPSLYIRDLVNSRMQITMTPSANFSTGNTSIHTVLSLVNNLGGSVATPAETTLKFMSGDGGYYTGSIRTKSYSNNNAVSDLIIGATNNITATTTYQDSIFIQGSSNFVGIRTEPLAPLHVSGPVPTVLYESNHVLLLTSPYVSGIAYSTSASFKLSNPILSSPFTRLDICLLNTGAGANTLPNVNVMSLLSDGKVGIGTISPSRTLHVVDSANPQMLVSGFASHATSQTSSNGEILLGATSTWQAKIGYDGQQTANLRFTNTYSISNATDGGFEFANGSTVLARIASNGNLISHGVRKVEIVPSSGLIKFNGDSGGWALGNQFIGSSGAVLGEIGAIGTGNTFSAFYMGPYATPYMTVTSGTISMNGTAGYININRSDSSRIGYIDFVRGNAMSPASARQGYIGYDNGKHITVTNEQNGSFRTNTHIISGSASTASNGMRVLAPSYDGDQEGHFVGGLVTERSSVAFGISWGMYQDNGTNWLSGWNYSSVVRTAVLVDVSGMRLISTVTGTTAAPGSALPTQPTTVFSVNPSGVITCPNIKISTSPTVGHVWTCTNVDGSGSWQAGSGGGSGLTWTIVTADGAMSPSNGYVANKGTLLTMSLPTTCAAGTIIRLSGMNAGLWKISQAAGQSIKFGNQSTTTGTGGYLSSVLTYDAVELLCIVADTTWMVISSVGNITVV